MKERVTFSVQQDVVSIEINAVNARISVREATDEIFKIEYPDAQNISVGSNADGVILSQQRFPFSKWKQQDISVFIPAHTVPSINVNAKNCDLFINGGIHGELTCVFEDGQAVLTDAVFGGVEITGGCVNAALNGVTVKGNLFLQIEKGNVLAENTFATRSDCKVKKGNIGLAFVNCKDCAFNTDKGNITATIAGSEKAFNTTLITREGTLNREGAKHEGADGSFSAYADKGNIVLDFAEENTPVPEVTENLHSVPNTDETTDGDKQEENA